MMTWRGGVGWEGGRLQREGMYVYTQLIHTVVQKELTQHCKAIILQLKIEKKKRIKSQHAERAKQTNKTLLII